MSTFENNITTTIAAPATTTIPFHNNTTHKRRAKTPSFSSILLDAIYRSIDDTYTDTDSSSSQHNHTPKTATTSISNSIDYDQVYKDGHNDYVQSSKHRRTKMRSHSHLETMELLHAIMIDSLIEKQPPLTPPQQPKQQQQQQHHQQQQQQAYYNNNNRGCYSKISSNADDNSKFNRQKSVPSRSNITASSSSTSSTLSCFTQPKNRTDITPKREMSSRIFNKTKLKALKIYGDLKKSKQHQHQHHQPISPGARIAAFLNSIFRNSAGATPRRPPINRSPAAACSSTSCLTVKPKRSAKYTHISDEYDHKNLIVTTKSTYDDQKQQQQQQRKWKREKEIDTLMMTMKRNRSNNDYRYKEVLKIEMNSDEEMMNVEEDEDDGESCASSSDLFELENFSSIGVSRFNQELPVYGTTCLKNLI